MIADQLSLFPEISGESVVSKNTKERHKGKRRKFTCDGEFQFELFSRDSPEMKMQQAAKKTHIAWLKRSLREYPHLKEKIERLEQLAVGIRDDRPPRTPQSPSRHQNYLSDDERYLAELIRTTISSAFHKKSTGLLTRGRFHQQVKTLVQQEPELQLFVENLIDFAREEVFTHSPVEKSVMHHENANEHAARMAMQLRHKQAIFEAALAQLQKFQPESYEILRLRYFLRYTAIKVQLELELESESTYAAHLREALSWLGKYVQDAQARLG